MKINFVRLQNFRNIEFAEVDFGADSIWIRGDNAQGKTNLLEAVGLLPALRSFRTAKNSAMIRHGADAAKILISLDLENSGNAEVEISLGEKRSAKIDGEEAKYSDYIGRFPAIAATNDDISLVRGSPEGRRRQIDMFASSLDAGYMAALRRFHAALCGRNALLRQQCGDDAAFGAFESEMAKAAADIYAGRKKFLDMIAESGERFYAELSGERGERAKLRLRPNCDYSDAGSYAELLVQTRPADAARQTSSAGPHRDDFSLELNSKSAKLYASEGQQRCVALAFRLAQFEIVKRVAGIEPVLLCDDVLAELDSNRRAAFWRCASPTAQLIATSTSSPPETAGARGARAWKVINAVEAKFFEADGKFAG